MNNLNGKLGDSFIAIFPHDDGTITVRRIMYSEVDFKEECPIDREITTEDGTLTGFTLTVVKVVINYIADRFDCKKDWIR